MKPLLNEKGSGVSNEVVLLEKEQVLRDDNKVAKEFHSCFNSIVSSPASQKINMKFRKVYPLLTQLITIMKFQFHPIILLVKRKINTSNSFSFTEMMLLIKKF